jgi:Ion transport protein
MARMSAERPRLREHGNAYNLFILVLTIFSLVVMGVLLLPMSPQTRQLLTFYDNVICLVFIGDFLYNVRGARPRRRYFINERGWLDLLGSIPTFGFLPFTALFRLARLSRLARITRLLGGKNRKELVRDMVENRGQYATFITLLSAGMVLTVASVLVLQFESQAPGANITTAGDAIWWGVVTITTVGYGDTFPVTFLGRLVGVSVMMAGVGIIGALASILASLLVPPPKTEETAPAAQAGTLVDADAVVAELAGLRAEVAALRADIQR